MLESRNPGGSLAWDFVWQSTLFLGLGIATSMALARRPARAHRFLLLGMLAALVSPILTQAVRRGGWGLLAPGRGDALNTAIVRATPTTPPPAPGAPLPTVAIPASDADNPARPVRIAGPHAANGPDTTARPRESALEAHNGLASIAWRTLVLGVWLTLLSLAAARLVMGLALGWKVVSEARLVKNRILEAAAAGSAARLGLGQTPELRVSPRVRCPAIWCWAHRPVIVLPDDAEMAAASVDWAGVFCHELAHCVRRDHWAGLLAEVLVCVLPWHPLTWWAKYRLGQQSELACDDWVLATGLPAAAYAETLLSLVPQRRGALALTAVSSRGGLFGRIQHILDERRSSPVVGKRWASASAAAVVLATSVLALAQSRPALSKGQNSDGGESKKEIAIRKDVLGKHEATRARTIGGTVLGPDGTPFLGATVFWVGHRKTSVSFVPMPKDAGHAWLNKTDVIARAMSDLNGRFSLSADFNPDHFVRNNGWDVRLLARAPGAGMISETVNADTTDLTLKLAPEVVIRGRLLTPSGMPAAGARITVTGFGGMSAGLAQTDDEIPSYWPQPRKTDADGRFTFEGMPAGAYVGLAFWHPDFAVDEVTVNTRADGVVTEGLRSFDVMPVPPNFTHALEPARPVQGRVTDKETGKPLVGILVEMIPMRSRGGMPFQTRTDADGRYRVSGHQTERGYYVNVYPPADSGYLAPSDHDQKWPAGAKFLEKNFALEKGRIVRGRVIDAGTKQPIASVAAVYQPKRGNPNNTRGYDFRNTVLTGQDGRFAITTLPGQGVLAVETPDQNYIRVVVRESYRGTVYPQGSAVIVVPEVGEPEPVAIEVRKGVTLEARAIGPDGQVVREITGFCKGIDASLIDIWDKAQPFEDGVFRLKGADPNKTYQVFLLQFRRRLGAVAELKFDPRAPGPIEVRLEPTARVHGEIVKPGGSPAMSGQVLPYLLLDKMQTELKSTDSSNRENALINVQLFPNEAWSGFFDKCRVRGKFEFEHLIPGARYGLSVRAGNLDGLASVPPLKPREDRDLGTITLKERPR